MAYTLDTGYVWRGAESIMSDINMTPLGGIGTIDDRFLVNEGMAGIKKCVLMETFKDGSRFVILEFPEIGNSLPAIISGNYFSQGHITAIYEIGTVSGASTELSLNIIEYGGQPDPEYFSIIGVDKQGKAFYGES